MLLFNFKILLLCQNIKKLTMADEKEVEKLKKQISALQKDNDTQITTQQELKAKIKELTELPPKVISGHVSGKVKYIRQERVKVKDKIILKDY